MSEGRIVKRSVRIAGHATSVSLEAEFWHALQQIAGRRQLSTNALLAIIDDTRSANLSSAIRLFVLDSCRRGELGADAEPARSAGVTGAAAASRRKRGAGRQ